ncbi:hypothetical protein [Vibrio fluminensis]|uniref:hypothetical protein n=1 Tax=Vibrio fluminensis TaxID=2783614 RepID=UPI0018886FF3|nr:hypothetical protein [Vibrio fluminensis]
MNKKLSFLAASMAIALAGCGGGSSSDNDGSKPEGKGIVITGFDGYFKNAVVFVDRLNNGVLDANDPILGFTNDSGKLEITAASLAYEAPLALQTLVPGGDVQRSLIAKDPQVFAGKYTVDMDNPTQAMANEVVFRTLPGEKVISPLTDLVVVQANGDLSDNAIHVAKTTVNETLGLNNGAVFTDVIAAGNHSLHKTAQILTESKVKAQGKYTPEVALVIAEKATDLVTNATPEQLQDENYKPVFEVSGETVADEPVINNKLIANAAVVDAIKSKLVPLDDHVFSLTLPLLVNEVALFEDADKDGQSIEITSQVVTLEGQTVTGLKFNNASGSELVITGTPNLVRPEYQIKLTATDVNATGKAFGNVTVAFDLQVLIDNPAPALDQSVAQEIQSLLNGIEIYQGVAVNAEPIRLDGLFTDNEALTYKAYTSVEDLAATVTPIADTGEINLTLSGTPDVVYTVDQTLTVEVTDGVNTEYQKFNLGKIEKPIAAIEIDKDAVIDLQEEINLQLADLKVGDAVVSNSFSIASVFEPEHTNGAVEYYAGTSDKEFATTVPGLTVNVDTNGTLTVSGKPDVAVKGGSFVIQAGVNPDEEGGVKSEPVTIRLPNVQPADEGTEGHPLVGKKWYLLENGRSYVDENGVEQEFTEERVWCETYEFKDGKVYGSNRTEANLTSCTPGVEEFTGATYEVYDDELIVYYPAEDVGGDVEEIVYQAVEGNNFANAQTVVMTELNSQGHEVKSRYTYFSDATDAQKRINIKSDNPWHQREVPMYIPGDVTPLTVSITLESAKAYINFDADGKDFTCDDFNALYSFSDFTDGEGSLGNGSCNNEQDTPENGEVTYQYASVFFNLNKTLESVHEGDVFSAIVNANSSALEPAENVRFNIEWTGKTDNE